MAVRLAQPVQALAVVVEQVRAGRALGEVGHGARAQHLHGGVAPQPGVVVRQDAVAVHRSNQAAGDARPRGIGPRQGHHAGHVGLGIHATRPHRDEHVRQPLGGPRADVEAAALALGDVASHADGQRQRPAFPLACPIDQRANVAHEAGHQRHAGTPLVGPEVVRAAQEIQLEAVDVVPGQHLLDQRKLPRSHLGPRVVQAPAEAGTPVAAMPGLGIRRAKEQLRMRLPVTAVVGRALGVVVVDVVHAHARPELQAVLARAARQQHQRVDAGRQQRARVLDVAPQVIGHAVQGLQVGAEQRSHVRRVAIGVPAGRDAVAVAVHLRAGQLVDAAVETVHVAGGPEPPEVDVAVAVEDDARRAARRGAYGAAHTGADGTRGRTVCEPGSPVARSARSG